MHKSTERFWKCYNKLPEKTKKLAKEQFNLLKNNPSHPSLRLKKVGELWSVRVFLNYRALSYKDNDGYIWVWIGNHDDYEALLSVV